MGHGALWTVLNLFTYADWCPAYSRLIVSVYWRRFWYGQKDDQKLRPDQLH